MAACLSPSPLPPLLLRSPAESKRSPGAATSHRSSFSSSFTASSRYHSTMSASIDQKLPSQVSLLPLFHGLVSARNGGLRFKGRSKESIDDYKHNHQKNEKKVAKVSVVKAFSGNRGFNGGRTPAVDRVLSAVGYFLPLLDGMQYGRFLFSQFPSIEVIFRPIFPLLRLYSSIPYANFVVFFTIYLALVKNPSFPRYVRFNAMQACVLDVLIVIPLIVQRILSPKSGFGLDLLILFYNAIFVSLLVTVVFGMVSCVLGKILRIPFVADAADNQLF